MVWAARVGDIDDADETIAVAAHELRKPIAAIQGNVQLMLRQLQAGGAPSTEQVKTVLERVEAQSHRLSALVGSLLTASRLRRDELHLDARDTDVRLLVLDAVHMVREANPERTFVVNALDAIVARVDAFWLQMVLSNLLDNALKFSPPDSEVIVSLALTESGSMHLVVRDHGPGVPEQQRERIFERYFQATSTGPGGGVGLGLYISRQIVRLHGGEIHVEEPYDGGARFVVVLPAQPSGTACGAPWVERLTMP